LKGKLHVRGPECALEGRDLPVLFWVKRDEPRVRVRVRFRVRVRVRVTHGFTLKVTLEVRVRVRVVNLLMRRTPLGLQRLSSKIGTYEGSS